MKSTRRASGTRPGPRGADGKTYNNTAPFTPECVVGLATGSERLKFFGEPLNACELRAHVARHAAALNEPVPKKIFVLMDEIDPVYLHKVSEVLINGRFQQHREPFAVVTAGGKGCVISIPVEEEE